jgi:hypothetical protein
MTKIAESGSGSISQRHGSADPDPLQNVMDLEHWRQPIGFYANRDLRRLDSFLHEAEQNFEVFSNIQE